MADAPRTTETTEAPEEARLDRVPIGRCGQISEVLADQLAVERLMAMGLCSGRHVEILRHVAYLYENRGDCDPSSAASSAKLSGATFLYDPFRVARI